MTTAAISDFFENNELTQNYWAQQHLWV